MIRTSTNNFILPLLLNVVFFLGNISNSLAYSYVNIEPITKVLNELSEKYQVFFTYDLDLLRDVNVEVEDYYGDELNVIINQILANTGLKYEQLGDKYYVIFAENKSGKKSLRKMKRKIGQIQKLEKKGNIDLQPNSRGPRKKLDQLIKSISSKSNSAHSISAKIISGEITKIETGAPLIGATVSVEGTDNGAVTDLNGIFSIIIESYPVNLVVSYTGYSSQNITVFSAQELAIKMEEGIALDQVVVTGTRGRPRTILTAAVPIDIINADELKTSGQKTVDQMISYKVPSYNSANQAISDATAHMDPSELRNLGPSRTLVLINGKRKNQSAQVYLNDTPGRGEVGTDMKSIPSAAIERIEVLRDGAAAQYGSDAIAGVINIILKEKLGKGEFNMDAGITTAGDGKTFSGDLNYGLGLGKKGFFNLTGEVFYQNITDRAGEFANEVGDPLFEIPLGESPELDAYFNAHPDLGITYGQPQIFKMAGMANFGTKYENGKFYGVLAYTKRKGKSFAFYRTWYWRDTDWGLLTAPDEVYLGYQPTFESDVNDAFVTVGNEYKFGQWDSDISMTYGSNSIDYTVNNSLNRTLGAESPTTFSPGGYSFSHVLGNIDFTRSYEKLSLAVGSEIRREAYVAREGVKASHSPAPGADSFPGLTSENALDEHRRNVGVYLSADYDATRSFLIGGAARFENYSDFGSNFSWKVNARQLLAGDRGVFRTSISTGFRAPSLHQIYLSNIQSEAGPDGLLQEGTFNNVNDIIRNILGVQALDTETSFNITVGMTYKLLDNLSVTLDYYKVKVNDRVLFSDQISVDNFTGTDLGDALEAANVDAFKFFINAVNTNTSGFDVVLNYDNIKWGTHHNILDLIFAMNINKTTLDGTVHAPESFGSVNIFGDVPSRLLTSARPNTKISIATNWKIGKFRISLNNTYFGKVNSPVSDQKFSGKLITDLILGYKFAEKFRINITTNNLFNVYPDRVDGKLDPYGYRLQYPWRVSQFGFFGT
ncbi:MAG: iron complex outermembrane receptor protein, partial [Ulvibacter sp.]